MAFRASVFTKFAVLRDIKRRSNRYMEFYPYRARNTENAGKNSFTALKELDCHRADFHETHAW
jgi:hypothetical protein